VGVNYQVATDGFLVVVAGAATNSYHFVYADVNNPPSTMVGHGKGSPAAGALPTTTVPLRKGWYFRVENEGAYQPPDSIRFYPLN
jgi:hypothetical protein